MPSPFPGMDPFLESQEWEDFHATFNTVVREQLAVRLRPDYLIRVERRVYLEHPGAEPESMRVADIAIVSKDAGLPSGMDADVEEATQPESCTLVMPEERRETYLVIRERESMEVVTIIELLSPANKRAGGDGRREYLLKREQILSSPTHLVEIDLLRGGLRLPIVEALPEADYFCIVSRSMMRPKADLYSWGMQHPLPRIHIPLKQGDGDATLSLQSVFETVYDRAGYDLSIDYRARLVPAESDDTRKWIDSLLSNQ